MPKVAHSIICFVVGITLVIAQPSSAQYSFHELSPGQSILGFDLSSDELGRDINGRLKYAINKTTAAIFSVGIGFLDPVGKLSSPPAPLVEIAIGKTDTLGQTPLGYFSYIGFDAASVRQIESETSQVVSTKLGLGPSIKVGVFKPLDVSPEFVVSPFFGLSYDYTWTAVGVEYSDLDFRDTTQSGVFSGMLGIEFDVLPSFGLFGALDFSFDDSETLTRVGVTFY